MHDGWKARHAGWWAGCRCRRGVGALLGAVVVLAAAGCQAEREQHYPGALPGVRTDVDSAQAFRHYGLAMPPSMRNLRYSARSEDDMYPMSAAFSINCRDLGGFVSRSSLERVASMNPALDEVGFFAHEHGWVQAAGGSTWYLRKVSTFQTVQGIVQRVTGKCAVYLTA